MLSFFWSVRKPYTKLWCTCTICVWTYYSVTDPNRFAGDAWRRAAWRSQQNYAYNLYDRRNCAVRILLWVHAWVLAHSPTKPVIGNWNRLYWAQFMVHGGRRTTNNMAVVWVYKVIANIERHPPVNWVINWCVWCCHCCWIFESFAEMCYPFNLGQCSVWMRLAEPTNAIVLPTAPSSAAPVAWYIYIYVFTYDRNLEQCALATAQTASHFS